MKERLTNWPSTILGMLALVGFIFLMAIGVITVEDIKSLDITSVATSIGLLATTFYGVFKKKKP